MHSKAVRVTINRDVIRTRQTGFRNCGDTAVCSRNRARSGGSLPPPDSSYGYSVNSYQSPTDLTMPAPDDFTNPDTVTIPIPGGGDITVDGPNAPTDTSLPNLPGSQWGVMQQTPFSHDIGPTLP